MTTTEYPTPLNAEVSKRMRANPRRDTKPERAFRSALHAHGLRFRKDHLVQVTDLTVRPDVVFPRLRIACFVDGCYWHCCPEHGTRARHNAGYWSAKLARNVERDRRVSARLRAAGWTVLRFWEHESPLDAAARVQAVVGRERRTQVRTARLPAQASRVAGGRRR